MSAAWRVVPDDPTRPDVLALIELHGRAAHANSPAGSVFALGLAGLQDPAVTMWTLREGDALLGMAALRWLDAASGEIKSMRTAPGQQRRGVARTLLAHLVAEARGRGWTTLKLETGGNDAFAPARALYEGAGFHPTAAFGDYVPNEFNRCYVLTL